MKRLRQPESMRIGITGSPGTGKKEVANELSKMTGLGILSLNEIAIRRGLGRWKGKGKCREFIVNIPALKKAQLQTSNKIVIGHLLPYVFQEKDLDFVAVLRTSPKILEKRFIQRHYPQDKIKDNLLSETLDIISYDTFSVFGRKVSEFNTSNSTAELVAKKILLTSVGKKKKEFGRLAWRIPHAYVE
jgi:adenylate kinase